jgi:hypothetical protein
MTTPLHDAILSAVASAIEPGTLVRSPSGQRCEWLGVDGGEVKLGMIGGWVHGSTIRRPIIEVMSRWNLCRSDA